MLTFSTLQKQGLATKPHRLSMGGTSRSQHPQIRHILRRPSVQTKLTIGAPHDKYEQEADRVADQVMRMRDPSPVEPTPSEPKIQHVCEECEEEVRRQTIEEEEEELLQPKRDSESGGSLLGPETQGRITAMRQGGAPLSANTRKFFEPRFRQDFSGVRVHTDAVAGDTARSVNALAYTVGQNIVFASGQYEPWTFSGQRLLAHELTHVIQQDKSLFPAQDNFQANIVQDGVSDNSIIQRALLGHFRYRSGTETLSGTVQVNSRTVEEWKRFLQTEADEARGNIELNAFMAVALGHDIALGGAFMSQDFTGDRPAEEDAINLMEAFLTTGSNIDLPDYSIEGFSRAQYRTAILMSEFNARFAGKTIEKMTTQSGEFSTDEFNAIRAYAGEAESQSEQTPHFIRQNPVHTLVASALGTAIGATVSLNTYSQEPGARSPDNERIHRAYNLITNSGKIIKATIEQAQEDEATTKTVLMTVFKTAVGGVGLALSAATGGAAAVAAGALSIFTPVAETFLDAALSGNGSSDVRRMLDDYNDQVDHLVTSNPPLLANFAANAKDAFERGLDF